MVGLLAENLVGIIDTAFLGHVGELELAASAIASTYYSNFTYRILCPFFENQHSYILRKMNIVCGLYNLRIFDD